MFVEEFAQVDTVSNQVGFFHGDNSQPENSAYLESTPRKQRLQRGYSSGHGGGKSYSLLPVEGISLPFNQQRGEGEEE